MGAVTISLFIGIAYVLTLTIRRCFTMKLSYNLDKGQIFTSTDSSILSVLAIELKSGEHAMLCLIYSGILTGNWASAHRIYEYP